MSDPFIGQVILFACNFAPVGFAFCQGQLLPISQNIALFSLLGTTYGGNGQTNFALPDLQGRAPLHFGQGAGLSDYVLGEHGGIDTIALAQSEMPQHSHALTSTMTATCRNAGANVTTPVGTLPGIAAGGATIYAAAAPDANMQSGAIALGGSLTAANTGGGAAHNNLQPYVAMNYCIALLGVFPPRG